MPLFKLAFIAALFGAGILSASALPVARDGMAQAATSAQFRQRDGGMSAPGRGGGMSMPGRGGGGGIRINPGIFLGPLLGRDGVLAPHRRAPVYVEDDDEDEVPRARPRRPKRPKAARAPGTERRPPVRQARPAAPRRPPPVKQARPAAPRIPPVSIPLARENRLVADEVLIELRRGADEGAVLRRHRLTRLASASFVLPDATVLRARVEGGRGARRALQEMAGDARIARAQPNYLYTLQEDGAVATAAPPPVTAPVPAPVAPKPQYALDKLGLADARNLVRGGHVKIALVDTGVDDHHPELEGAIAKRFDALEGAAVGALKPSLLSHGTAMAGALVAKASLRGVSPGASLLAARAFGDPAAAETQSGAQGTSFHILQSLDWASAEGARVFNLSFAGPQDRLLGRALEGARARKIIAIAAVGNAGPGTPPLYPAAEPSVLAVTATDAQDAIYKGANTGPQVAIAAPGVDVIAAAPEAGYAFSSGTSIAAAHVAGLVALMLEKNPALELADIRQILRETAEDLGARGADTVFGAGRANAAAALARAQTWKAKAP